jgi:hypothetical protein
MILWDHCENTKGWLPEEQQPDHLGDRILSDSQISKQLGKQNKDQVGLPFPRIGLNWFKGECTHF